MKKTIITLLALCGVAAGDNVTHTWIGETTGEWTDSSNWDTGEVPDQNDSDRNDYAIIPEGDYNITWTNVSGNVYGATVITLNHGNVLTMNVDTGSADFWTSRYELNGNATIKLINNGQAVGYGSGRDFTIDYGSFTLLSYGLFDASGLTGKLWGNSNTISLTGTLDLTSLSGAGTIDLYKNAPDSDRSCTIDTTGLNWQSSDANITTELITENGSVSIKYSVATPTPAIPEPTTATLSLLALAGLAARRRRR